MHTGPSQPRLLIANRGEIACRIIRGARDEGWHTISVYSEADRTSPHVLLADEAQFLGPAPALQSYLDPARILEAATRSRATHLHPGYGFFSENADFAQTMMDAGLTWIGPTADAIESMGDKVSARLAAEKAGVPLVPGSPPLQSEAHAIQMAERIGFPVLIKAAFGGGGKGMRLCHDARELTQALGVTRGEAGRSFGNDTLFLERALLRARHVEIQVLCDTHGNGVYLGERECSIQRRHQKLVEETPCVALTEDTRRAMGEAAVRLALGIGYVNAGTIEFLMDESGAYYFLEMNTRLQVEHPITEQVTGIDLVREQLRIAQGERLRFTQADIVPVGASIECRIIAEDPAAGFLPASGPILWARLPEGPGVRNDVGFETGNEVSVHYDSMIGKLITTGRDREDARIKMRRALREYAIQGVRTNLPFLEWVIDHPEFIEGRTYTQFVDDHFRPEMLNQPALDEIAATIAAVVAHRDRSGSAPTAHSVSTGAMEIFHDRQAPRPSAWKARGWRHA
jgi:acetyl-CoA carboxylase biotin carboxylase subunit